MKESTIALMRARREGDEARRLRSDQGPTSRKTRDVGTPAFGRLRVQGQAGRPEPPARHIERACMSQKDVQSRNRLKGRPRE